MKKKRFVTTLRGLASRQASCLSAVLRGIAATTQQNTSPSEHGRDKTRTLHGWRQNQTWSMDFVSDQLINGQRIRALDVKQRIEAWRRMTIGVVLIRRSENEAGGICPLGKGYGGFRNFQNRRKLTRHPAGES